MAKAHTVFFLPLLLLFTLLTDVGAFTGQVHPGIVRLPSALARQLIEQWIAEDEMAKSAYDEKREAISADPASVFSAEGVDLNGDGRAELLVRQADGENVLCSAHNCPVWVYERKKDGKYKLLLKEIAGYLNPLTALARRTNGYRDIRIQQHSSAVEHDVVVYRFDGRRYQARECLTETYVERAKGRGHLKVDRHACSPPEENR